VYSIRVLDVSSFGLRWVEVSRVDRLCDTRNHLGHIVGFGATLPSTLVVTHTYTIDDDIGSIHNGLRLAKDVNGFGEDNRVDNKSILVLIILLVIIL
jgi:hypothetical protein